MTERIDCDRLGLLLAAAWSLRGTCVRRRVGCVLVDHDGHQLSSGYNGPASGLPHCIDEPCPGASFATGIGLDVCESVHSEANALMRCADVRRVFHCYVTCPPCVTCVKMLMNTGCQRIVFSERYAHDEPARALWQRHVGLGATGRWVYLPHEGTEYGIVRYGVDRATR